MKTSILLFASLAHTVFAGSAMSSSWPAWPVNGTGGIAYETITTTAFTTYCPEATVFSHAGVTYTSTEATIMTITDCPCTITRVCPSFLPFLLHLAYSQSLVLAK